MDKYYCSLVYIRDRSTSRPILTTDDCCVNRITMTYHALFTYLVLRTIGLTYVCLILKELRTNMPVEYLLNNLYCLLCRQGCVVMWPVMKTGRWKWRNLFWGHILATGQYSQSNCRLLDCPLFTLDSVQSKYTLTSDSLLTEPIERKCTTPVNTDLSGSLINKC